jgi:hypothetical protein
MHPTGIRGHASRPVNLTGVQGIFFALQPAVARRPGLARPAAIEGESQMTLLGIGLIVSGLACVILGIIILALAAIQLRKQMFPSPAAPGAPGVSLPDLTNLIEAIVKVPQWLLAILAGDGQIWLGLRTIANLSWWPL